MAGGNGGIVITPAGVAKERAEEYQGKATVYVVVACFIAATGGALFGYDIGISGGVTSMDGFLKKFFKTVYIKKQHAHESNYCKYDNQGLAAFTSSLYLAGMVASVVASPVTRNYGRKASIICGGISFLVGASLNAGAVNLAMLIFGRIMLGVGIGFGDQVVPLYLSEMAPTHLRGGLNMTFQLATTLGIFTANMINYGTQKLEPWGWRLSLGLAAAPALLMIVGGIFIPETPNSLIERGNTDKGRKILEKIRGTENVSAEFQDMMDASELANAIKHPFRNILKRRNRPQLVMAILLPAFQILTGINSILFYAPVLFQSMGFGGNASLYASALTGAVLFSSTLVAIVTVDRLGRRTLLISGGILMITCQVIVAIILAVKFGNNQELTKGFSILVVTFICIFVFAFGVSWGGLGWTIPSEIFPLETRSAGQSITVAVNLLFTFIIAQSFLALLCAFKFGIFLFFASWITVMTIFVYAFLPETKGVPIEEMILLWRKHWFWKKIVAGPQEFHASNGKQTNETKLSATIP
ncbi:sugar transport protein 7 isoform X1 [Tripterygium wilfordii]|uniref:Sugar transport protein 7 isoform X1 n=1 Tax=Tripterygium wilfordii TaxID=458696 RepID=A0A7J7DTU9_TRIWF|nr:sugar transport protein 7-like [Tripterygium wilfordii]KAF5749556.1 sugar transport protein 7 isoform X1 [Tripterygium wilfordii]